MDERKIIWSRKAEEELRQILEFYINRNGTTKYSAKLLVQVEKLVTSLIKYPKLGHLAENKVTRVIVKAEFLIFYEITDRFIEIVSFWDGRQDPKNRIDKK